MKGIVFLFIIFISVNAEALYVSKTLPAGNDADTGSEIKIEFGEDITALGVNQVRPDQVEKLSINPAVNCKWAYEGTRSVKCRPQQKLIPDTAYIVTIQNGFPGNTMNNRIGYEQKHSFTTNKLAMKSYKISWKDSTVTGEMVLNYLVKPAGVSGVISCEGKDSPAIVSVQDKNKIQVVTFSAVIKDQKNNECVFYFNRPLELKNFPKTSIPDQKIILTREISSMESAGDIKDVTIGCQSSYNRKFNLSGSSIPTVSCEFSDHLSVYANRRDTAASLNLKFFPSDGIKIENEGGQYSVSGFKAGQTYAVKIPAGFTEKIKKDFSFIFSALESPPLLGSKKTFGVIERDGPWKIAYSAMNIKSLNLNYGFFSASDELGSKSRLTSEQGEYSNDSVVPVNLPANENHLLPLDIKKIAEKAGFKAGLFRGTMKVKEVEERYLVSERELSGKEEWEYKGRRQFSFNYLFTDLGLHMKKSPAGIFIWVTSLKSGKPLEGVEVTLYDQGAKKSDSRTDKSGIAEFDWESGRGDGISVVARKGDDVSFISTEYSWGQGISPYDFNLVTYDQEESGASNGLISDVVTERPLYLPGETVELKVFVREEDGDALKLPETKNINITIHDSRGEEIHKTQGTLNKYGTLAVTIPLESNAVTGAYAVYLSSSNITATFPKAFQVQEFRKPEIKVVMNENETAYTGKVTYYSGGELANAEGEVAVVFKPARYKPVDPQLKEMSFPNEVGGRYSYWDEYNSEKLNAEVISRDEISTDEKGQFEVSKDSILRSVHKYGHLAVEAIFRDSSGGKVAGRVSTLINPYKYLPAIKLNKWYYAAGEKMNPAVAAVDAKGKIAENVKMELEVTRKVYHYERRLGSGNYFYYDSRVEESSVSKCKFTSSITMSSCEVTLKEPGDYDFKVKVAGETKLGPAVTGTWVMRKGEFFSYRVENHDRINLSIENTQIKLGEKFKLMALTPFSDGEAIITFERDGVIFKDQFSFKGNVIQYEKAIDDEKFIPGFYASLVIVKGRTSEKVEGEIDLGRPQFKIGYGRVEVVNLPKRLLVNINPARKIAKPGEMMEATIEIKDYKGIGSPTELAIAVVDDSILSLSGDYRGHYDILDTFYKLKKSRFSNFNTLTQLIGRRTFGKKGADPGGGGGIEIRSDLKNTAFWQAQVETDKEGRYKLKFKLPQNLTTWKIIAVAVDQSHRFGFGEVDFLATKPLTVEPNLPNFLIEGDKFKAQLTIANRSGTPQDVTVAASAIGLKLAEATKQVKLKDGERSPMSFNITTESVPKAELTLTAKAGKLNDGIKVSLPVERNSLNHVNYVSGLIEGKEVTHALALPSDARKESLKMTVEYSHTAMSGLEEVFKYVLGYPYGCWEQRLSKAYFLVQYEAFKDHMSYRFDEKQGSIKDAVQNLLNLAPDYQSKSGGMEYYPESEGEGDAYLSIFTGHSFVLMKKMGYKINEDVEKNLRVYLKRLLVQSNRWNESYIPGAQSSNKTMILNVLAEMGETNLTSHGSKLYAERNNLDLFGLSFLGGFLNLSKGFEKETTNVFDRLQSLSIGQGNAISFKDPVEVNDEWKWWNHTDTRSQCAVLQNLIPYTNDKVYAGKLVRGILSRMEDGHWYNTQENMYCFEGLRRFVEKFEAKNKEGELEVKIDGNKVSKEPKINKNIRQIQLEASDLSLGMKKISLMPKEKAELYYSTSLRYETPYKERAPTDNGFALDKKYYLKDGKNLKELKGNLIKLSRGDVLKVVLQVTTPVRRFRVMLNDRLAACFEPINMSLATSSEADAAETDTEEPSKPRSPWFDSEDFDYVDLRLNAAQFYAKKLKAGTSTVEYLVQVRVAGEFSLPEATVEEMYYPDIRGTFTGKKIIVNE
ncbi:MAG: alpha-2-macroglobulin family protein [Bdellovibrionota bacterium]